MKLFKRQYETLKLFGEKYRTEELERLSENEDDFTFRRLFIEENERMLHIAFSRKKVFEWISYSFMGLSVCYFNNLTLSIILLGISFISQGISIYFGHKFKKRVGKYQFGLNLVNIVITDTYGISF